MMEGILTTMLLVLNFMAETDAVLLRCYSCPLTTEETVRNSNLQCLSNGYNVSCDVINSRCFTRVIGSALEKGCTSITNCHVGNEYLCCGTKYCNGGHGMYQQTGYGEECNTNADCVQQEPDMECIPKVVGSSNHVCMCLPGRRRQKAICLPNGISGMSSHSFGCFLVVINTLLRIPRLL